MGIFGDLFSGGSKREAADRDRVLKHWGLDETETETGSETPAAVPPAFEASHYDQVNWRKKLQRILDDLPASEPEWADFLADAYALGFDERWIGRTLRDEFTLLIRRAVADHVVTDAEHRKLDVAAQMIGLSDAEAESIYRKVVAEAEQFFGAQVEGS